MKRSLNILLTATAVAAIGALSACGETGAHSKTVSKPNPPVVKPEPPAPPPPEPLKSLEFSALGGEGDFYTTPDGREFTLKNQLTPGREDFQGTLYVLEDSSGNELLIHSWFGYSFAFEGESAFTGYDFPVTDFVGERGAGSVSMAGIYTHHNKNWKPISIDYDFGSNSGLLNGLSPDGYEMGVRDGVDYIAFPDTDVPGLIGTDGAVYNGSGHSVTARPARTN